MMFSDKKLDRLNDIINNSEYTVCIIGSGMQVENGYPSMHESDWAYEMEMKYGDSPEEIFNTSFYSTRKEQFFDFYKMEMISTDREPDEAYKAVAGLQKKGLINTVITTGIYSLAKRAGCEDVIELHGSIYNNYCGHCRKSYDLEYVRSAQRVPLCTECNSVIRPGVFLFGEMIDNSIMTRAMEEIARADTLLICGANVNSGNIENCLSYFKGNNIVVINDDVHYSNSRAQLLIQDKPINVLPEILTQ